MIYIVTIFTYYMIQQISVQDKSLALVLLSIKATSCLQSEGWDTNIIFKDMTSNKKVLFLANLVHFNFPP